MTKKVTVLGSTGSIGTQSLDVIRAQEYSVFGLAAHSNVELLLRQVQEFHPHCIAVVDDAAADRAARELHGMPGAPVLLRGKEGLEELAAMDGSDIVLNAVVGIAGLAATLSAIKSGRDVALVIEENPPIRRVIAVQNEPQFFADFWFDLKTSRPMPVYSVPGLVDHF